MDAPFYRPRRSVLFVPGANPRALAKAVALGVDAVVLDLEDSVAPDVKSVARQRVCAMATPGGFGRSEVTVRVNALGTDWHAADLAAVAAAGPDAVVVPKVGSAADVHVIEAALEAGGAPPHTSIWAMLETPRAVLHAEAIATASPRLEVLVTGTNDLAKELRAAHVCGRAPLLTALSMVVLAARTGGVDVLDGVFNDVDDVDAFTVECRQARELGFDGKTLIHPGQVQPCHTAFSPSASEIGDSREVIAAFEAAGREGRAVATVRGRMIENLHVEQAARVLAVAAAIGVHDRDAHLGVTDR